MFTRAHAIAMTAAGLAAGLALGRAAAGLRLTRATALPHPALPPPAPLPPAPLPPGLLNPCRGVPRPGVDVPSPGHPDTFSAASEDFERLMAALRDELFPDQPYIFDLQDWLEADL